jgi:hypothetical protein
MMIWSFFWPLSKKQGQTCFQCTVGAYCDVGAVAPVACPAGTYTAFRNASSLEDCLDAPAGSYIGTAGASAPTLCSPGYYSEATGATQQTPCPAGTSCPAAGYALPSPCAAGKYSIADGAVTCLTAAPGYFAPSGATQQTPCPTGSACVGGTEAPVECEAGTYAPLEAASSCTVTPKGYWTAPGASEPTACPAGTYLPTTGATGAEACIACSGAYTCPEGSGAQSSCSAGTYVNGATCSPCSAGHYCPAGADAPVPCPKGTFTVSTGAESAITCTFAPVGYHVSGTGATAAVLCPEGTFSPVTGASACQPCTAGTYDAVTQGRNSTCPLCAVNSYCPAGTSQLACPAHTISAAGAGSQLGCACLGGFHCAYTKRISATVAINSTVSAFESDAGGVRTAFIAAVAAAAGVPIGRVTIVGVTLHQPAQGGGRRMLSLSYAIEDADNANNNAKPVVGAVKASLLRRTINGQSVGDAQQQRGGRMLPTPAAANRIRVHFEIDNVHPSRDFRRFLVI